MAVRLRWSGRSSSRLFISNTRALHRLTSATQSCHWTDGFFFTNSSKLGLSGSSMVREEREGGLTRRQEREDGPDTPPSKGTRSGSHSGSHCRPRLASLSKYFQIW